MPAKSRRILTRTAPWQEHGDVCSTNATRPQGTLSSARREGPTWTDCSSRQTMAGLVVRVATPATQEAWLGRAAQRTFKHLKEEVEAVEQVQRYFEGAERDVLPPSTAEMAMMHGLERDVLTGRALRRALGIVRPDLDGASAAAPVGTVRDSFLAYQAAFEQATAFGIRSAVDSQNVDDVTDVWTADDPARQPGEVHSAEATRPGLASDTAARALCAIRRTSHCII